MRRIVNLKLCGIFYLVLDITLQGCWIFGVSHTEWIYKYSLHNSFLLWCFAAGIFGESKLLGWLALFGILTVVLLTIYFWYTFFRKKGNFLIPLFMTLSNVIVHMVFYWKNPFSYVGLLYKIISFVIFICIVYKEYMNRNDICRKNNL